MSYFRFSSYVSLIGAFFAVTVVQSVSAHVIYGDDRDVDDEQPSCSSVWVDPDGDGYGWDTLHHSESPHSCVVTEASAPKPLYLREVNGDLRNIELIRPYWDANADLAAREIECSVMKWNAAQDSYNKFASATLVHSYMRDSQPWIGSYSGVLTAPTSYDDTVQDWNISYDYKVVDGSYFGKRSARLFGPVEEYVRYAPPLNQWLEIITVDGQQGVRLRGDPKSVGADAVVDGSQYVDCFDTAGNDFKPTGQWGQPGSSPGFTSSENIIATGLIEPMPEVVNPETQVPVNFKKAVWNLVTDVFGQEASCINSIWYDSQNGGHWDVHWDVYPQVHLIMPPEPGTAENEGIYYSESPNYGHYTLNWRIDNGVIVSSGSDVVEAVPSMKSQWYEELTDQEGNVVGVTYWSDDSRVKSDCRGPVPTGGSIAIEDGAGQCDYSDADMFDGWGWNEITGEGCPPPGTSVESEQSANTGSDDSDSSTVNVSGNEEPSTVNSDANSQAESGGSNSGGGSSGLSLWYLALLLCVSRFRSVRLIRLKMFRSIA